MCKDVSGGGFDAFTHRMETSLTLFFFFSCCCTSYLNTVLQQLSTSGEKHVSFRSSKLTFLLQSSLGGNARVFLIFNVRPEVQYVEAARSTLRQAQRARKIDFGGRMPQPHVKRLQPSDDAHEALRAELHRIREENENVRADAQKEIERLKRQYDLP